PGTLAIDKLLESVRAARGIKARAELQASNVRWRKFRRVFFDEPFAEAIQPDAELVVRDFLAVRKKKREVGRKCLVDPLIAIVRPSDNISPPLMSDFMKGNEIVKVLLTTGRKSGTLLSFRRKKRISGNIEKSRPALAKRTRNLRNA